MGYVCVQRKTEDHSIIHTDMLHDSSDRDDELIGIHPGAQVDVVLEIDGSDAQNLIAKKIQGVFIRKKALDDQADPVKYEVVVHFIVIRRAHTILRDWMTEGVGFRSTGTTVFIEAVTSEAEAIFLELQKLWDSNREML